uniref:Si:ch211-8c17.2 n=1 Tax=Cyprinus carpio carpio TaxID=630221 RepID=A0A8C1AP21_CYPCA
MTTPTLTVLPQSSLFTGDSVTLTCEVDQSWSGLEFLWSKNSNTETTEAATKTIDSVKVSDGGEYRCSARKGGYYTDYSEPVTVTIYERPKAKVSIKPDQHVFRGETVTLRCDIDGEGVTSWEYSWYKDGSGSVFSELQEHTFSPVTESDAGKYSCYGAERGGSRTSYISDEVTLTVSQRPKAKVSIKPDQHVFRGETVTLRCDIDGGGVTSWQYRWYKDSSLYSKLQEHTFSPVAESVTGKYFCYGAESEGSRTSQHSDEVTLKVSDIPKPTLTVLPQSSLFTGDSVTLRCEVDHLWDGWEFLWSKNSNTESTEAATKSIDSVKVSDGGEYRCRSGRGGYYTHYSEPVTVTIYERPKVKVSIKPAQHVFRGETVTLRCDIDGEGVTSWEYRWYKDGSFYSSSELQEYTFSPVTESDAGKYSCYGAERGGSRRSQHSDAVTLKVSDRAQTVLSVSPQKWLTEGDPVTLICEVYSSSTGWTFSWFSVTASPGNRYHYQLLSDSSRGAGGNYTVSSAALKHTGVYVCRAERGNPAYNTTYSNTQPVWVTGVSPQVSLVISPSRTQHFTFVSLSLSCEDQSNSDRWRVRRYTENEQWEDCSSLLWASQTGSTCTFIFTFTSDTGVYWCQSESGENYHPVNITVHYDVILESPVHPVTEGDTLTLRCLYKFTTPQNLRADFYKDGSLLQNQTTEMIISNVSKSHEGFYYCKHSERGESPKSWISVRASRSDDLNLMIIGVTAGLTVTFLITVFLVLLWRYRNNKGVRSQSPSSVSQQQNSSQTSEQNQSDGGYNTLLSGTGHIYDSVDATIKKDINTDSESGPTDLTYAEIEHKSTKTQMKKKENRGNNTESCDIVYSKLKLEMDQGAGSSDVTYAQVK